MTFSLSFQTASVQGRFFPYYLQPVVLACRKDSCQDFRLSVEDLHLHSNCSRYLKDVRIGGSSAELLETIFLVVGIKKADLRLAECFDQICCLQAVRLINC